MSARAVAGAVNELTDQRPPLSAIIFNPGIVRRSLIVAIIVGTILNLIAQGDFLLDGQPLNFWKICLTYCVPYCVATYGAVSARLETYRKQAATAAKDLA
ncbi:MAG TPA: nitrate/nitrite transporter NrtS [Alphaproteobacteria bacterium]|nr:nitrate/nitrite transporter NrtS [Alphaproteobacteria bacterium]